MDERREATGAATNGVTIGGLDTRSVLVKLARRRTRRAHV